MDQHLNEEYAAAALLERHQLPPEEKQALRKSMRARFLSILLGIVFLGMLGITVYAEYLLSMVNYVEPDATAPTLTQEQIDAFHKETEAIDVEFTGPEEREEDVILETAPQMEVQSEEIVNILLIGVDTRKNEPARSDSMILCTLNKHTNTITLTSFMRDMYVKIPGYKNNRINASFFFGGMQLLNKTLNQNFGVVTDGIVEIDFANFEKLIDMLGGIELDINRTEANFITQKTGKRIQTGVQVLNGEQALWYSRCRSDSRGDFNRTNRQRIVLSTLLNEYKNQSLPALIGMMDDVLPMVTTNMTKDEILDHVTNFFPMLATAEIVTQRIPEEGAYRQTRINDMSVLVPDISECIKVLQKTMEVPEPVEETVTEAFSGGVG